MAGQQQQQGQSDNSLAFLWIIVGLFVFGWLVWNSLHAYIVYGIFQLKLFELNLASFFYGGTFPEPLASAKSLILNSNPADVTFMQLAEVAKVAGMPMRYPSAILLATFGVLIYFSNVTLRFKNIFSMQRFLDSVKSAWPLVIPVVKLDLIKEPIDKGKWSMALIPMVFAKKYKLLTVEVASSVELKVSNKQVLIAKVKRGAAHRVFALQLGKPWQGIESLNPQTKALFAIFAACAARDRDGANKLLDQIAGSATKKLDFSGTDKLLKKHIKNKRVAKLVQQHAYISTLMPSMLKLARTDGVLASAEFLWLRPIERRLWYILNTVGRQTAVPEVAGIYAHWLGEVELGRRINVPMVDEAVNALELAIAELIYKPEEGEEVP